MSLVSDHFYDQNDYFTDENWNLFEKDDKIFLENNQEERSIKVVTSEGNLSYESAYILADMFGEEVNYGYKEILEGRHKLEHKDVLDDGKYQWDIPENIGFLLSEAAQKETNSRTDRFVGDEAQYKIAESLEEFEKQGLKSNEVANECDLSPNSVAAIFVHWEREYDLDARMSSTTSVTWNRTELLTAASDILEK